MPGGRPAAADDPAPAGKPAERADRWSTVPVRRRVLGVVRTLTALDRLHDVFAVLADDFRVELRFTIAAGSAFGHDLERYLRDARMRAVPWEQATAEPSTWRSRRAATARCTSSTYRC